MKKIMIAGEKYTDNQGAEKVKWIEAGVIMEKNGKEFVLLHKHVNLAAFESQPGKTSVICSIFEDDNQGQQPQQGQSHYAQGQQAPQQQSGYAGQGQQQAPHQQHGQREVYYDANGQEIPV